ncbi:MAG: DUF3500 domain-containing protein [Pirellulaceae bacterium]
MRFSEQVKLVAFSILSTSSLLPSLAHEGHEHKRSNYVSEASHLVGSYKPSSREHSPEAMAGSAKAFSESLTEEQRKLVSSPLRDAEREKWTNLPQRSGNGGLPLGKCNDAQMKAFCDMLATLLSEQGYQKMCEVMLADDQLLTDGKPRAGFGTEDFFVVLFGTPSATEPWGFQLDGHHLGLNLSIEGERVTFAPSHIGMQPDAFTIGEQDFRPLGKENDSGFALVNSLTDSQRSESVLSDRRGPLVTGPGNDEVPSLPGVSCSSFDESQRKNLLQLIALWVNDLPEEQAAKRMSALEAEVDKMTFGWKGPLTNGSAMYYSIQGPTLIIEYGAQDDAATHIHTMYRDPANAYGKQLN